MRFDDKLLSVLRQMEGRRPGKGRVQIGDSKPLEVREGDVVRIPANTAQRIENTGDECLVFYAVCSPRFRQDAYVALEAARG